MEERRIRIGSLFEWVAAALGVFGLIWLLSGPVQRIIGPHVEASLVEPAASLPPGVPSGATSVAVLVLLDGREIRVGELHTRVLQLLPETLLSAPPLRSEGEFGERQTRLYVVNDARFSVVCERGEPGGPLRVSGIFLP
jgi:hypothetical protein